MVNQDFEYDLIRAATPQELVKKVQIWLDEMAKGSGYAARVEGGPTKPDPLGDYYQAVVKTRVDVDGFN